MDLFEMSLPVMGAFCTGAVEQICMKLDCKREDVASRGAPAAWARTPTAPKPRLWEPAAADEGSATPELGPLLLQNVQQRGVSRSWQGP